MTTIDVVAKCFARHGKVAVGRPSELMLLFFKYLIVSRLQSRVDRPTPQDTLEPKMLEPYKGTNGGTSYVHLAYFCDTLLRWVRCA